MSTSSLSDLERIEALLNAPKTNSAAKKSWHSAFLTIYCARAVLSHFTLNKTEKKKPRTQPSPSFIGIDLNPHQTSTIDQKNLAEIVKEKSLDEKHGGVEGVAAVPETDTEYGIKRDDGVVDLNPHQPSTIDLKTRLTELVKVKSLESLENHGGVEGVAAALGIDTEYGIKDDDAEDIARRHQVFGSNTYHKPPSKGLFHFVVEALKDGTVLINLACAALSLWGDIKKHGLKEGWYDGGSNILAAVFIILLPSISNFALNRQFHKSSQVTTNHIKIDVVRSGRRQHIPIFHIVVGDIVFLKIGDQVPADGLFIDGHSLRVDEASMRGESDPVQVSSRKNRPFLTSGTKVVDGYAKMLVTSVGMNTVWGQMMSSISRDIDEQTPLQARLSKLKSFIVKVGLAVPVVVLLVLLIRYFARITKDENGVREFNGSKTKLGDVINAVVGILAHAVDIVAPEGLPLVATLALIYSMKKMITDHAMVVQKLSAFETMVSATVICTDKTGTLTLNQMKVTKFWLGLEPVLERANSSVAPCILQLIQEGVALNTTGSVHKPKSGSDFEFSGSPTEKAILSWAVLELNMEIEHLTKSCSILQVETFNSMKKRSGVLLRRKRDNTVDAHWKGAAEIVFKLCSRYYDASGIVKDLDNDSRLKLERIIEGMAASSLRCIAFAHVEVPEEELEDGEGNTNIKDNGLTLLGLVGIKDQCRPRVKNEVEACLRAGVNVKMITGDNVFAAKAIATECGILRPDQDPVGAVVEAAEFRSYTPEERLRKVEKIRVMARSSPLDKLLMVQCLKQKGHVVAVIGDGIYDASALKEADIGLSMGIQGTQLAKESSNIVILDENFASVVTVLKRGRCVYNNIQKFIQFQLTVFVAALATNFVADVSAGEMPLAGAKFLWMNLIMDMLGAFALATDNPTKEMMHKPPVRRTQPLITNIMWRSIFAQALYQIAVLLTLQFRGKSIFGVTSGVKDTLIFNTFVLCQMFNEFNPREVEKPNIFKGVLRCKLFLGIIGMTIVLQVLMVELLKKFADTERLN